MMTIERRGPRDIVPMDEVRGAISYRFTSSAEPQRAYFGTSGVSLPNDYRAAPLAPHRAGVRGGDPALSRPENRGRRLVVTSTPSADTVH